MKSKKKVTNLTKGKTRKIKDIKELNNIVSLNLFTTDDLRKLNLIDTKTYNEYLKREVDKNYEGSDVDE